MPPIPWIKPLNCTKEGPPCWGAKSKPYQVEGDFDCLHINVFTNNIHPETPFSVMVWIHGGGWMLDSSTTKLYGPDYLVDKNVTVVTLNYRLGAFGFLSLDDEALNVPGNQAFKDQRLALKWIQRNIANFGGDPSSVTLFGQSAGAGSVHYHMISEGSRDLFHQGILMAGSAFQHGYSWIPRRDWAHKLAVKLGFKSKSDGEVLKFLESANPKEIVENQMQMLNFKDMMNEGFGMAFGPTVEPYRTPGIFLDDEISTLVQNGWGNNISIMIGATSFAGLESYSDVRNPLFWSLFSNFENYIPRELDLPKGSKKSKIFARMLKRQYYGQNQPTINDTDGILQVVDDLYLWFPAHRTVRNRLESGSNASTFVYRFDADSENNVFKILMMKDNPELKHYREPMHGDDFAHIFKSVHHKPLKEMNQASYNTLQLMVTLFTNFACEGQPSADGVEFFPSVHELNLDANVYLYGLNIQENGTQLRLLPEATRIKTFHEIFFHSAMNKQKNGTENDFYLEYQEADLSAAIGLNGVMAIELTLLLVIGYFVF